MLALSESGETVLPLPKHGGSRFSLLGASTSSTKVWSFLKTAGRVVSAAASGYHGTKRNHGSVFWGAAWFGAGYFLPVITPTIAVAQGFGKPSISCKG